MRAFFVSVCFFMLFEQRCAVFRGLCSCSSCFSLLLSVYVFVAHVFANRPLMLPFIVIDSSLSVLSLIVIFPLVPCVGFSILSLLSRVVLVKSPLLYQARDSLITCHTLYHTIVSVPVLSPWLSFAWSTRPHLQDTVS